MRPDAPAESGEGFKRSWSEAKEEAGWTEDGQGSGKRAGVSGLSSSWYLQFFMLHGLLHWIGVIMCSNKVVPQLMAMAQGGMEEKWNTAQVTTFCLKSMRFESSKKIEATVSVIYICMCD